MKLFALALGLAGVAAQNNCTATGLAAYQDPNFAWLVSGNNDQRASNVSAICATADNAAKTNFYNKINDLIAACVPAGTDVSTSSLGVVVSLLNKVLCEQKTDLGSLRYCILSMLPLFDINYFLSLSSGQFNLPPLTPVSDSTDRRSAMCLSSVCNAYIENVAPGLLANLPQTTTATAAATFIRGTVNRMRCGCVGSTDPCYSSKVTSALLSNGAFVNTVACDANGMPTECARVHMSCENVPPPTCVKPCVQKTIATIKFRLANLKADCVANVDAIKQDVVANVPGLLPGDFACACKAAVAPAVGTACECNVTCGNLLSLPNVNLVTQFSALSTLSNAMVVPTPYLDRLLPSTCKITANADSYGSGFVLESATMAPGEPSSAVSVLPAAAAMLLASLVF